MITHEPSNDLLTVSEAAAALHVSTPTVRRWIGSGKLPAVKLGPRIVRLRRHDVAALSGQVSADDAPSVPWWAKYATSSGDPRISLAEWIARAKETSDLILAERGGVPFDDSLPHIHEARREREERL
jgi:excisionase family DNA binding protein